MINLGIFSLILVCLDQIIKHIVELNMKLNSSINIINGFFDLTYVRNNGAAFSILENNRILLITVTIIALIGIFIYLKTKKINKLEIVTYSILIGGIIGNLIDRLLYGYVIDYLDFKIFNYNFPIFNLADTLIVIGAFLLIITMLVGEKNERIQNNK